MNLPKNVRLYGCIVVMVIVVLAAWGVHINLSRQGKMHITISTAPRDASVTINGHITNGRGVYLANGSYDITVASEGFATRTQQITVDSEDKSVSIGLAPISDEAKKLVQDSSRLYSEDFNPLASVDPLLTRLPYQNLLYTIERVGDEPPAPVTLKIRTVKGYRNAPIDQIQRLGGTPGDYRYEFNYTNPFEQEGQS